MATRITPEYFSLSSFFDQRLAGFKQRRQSHAYDKYYQKREVVLYQQTDDESTRRSNYPDFIPIEGLKIDPLTGFLYTPSWHPIPPQKGYQLLGQEAKSGLDYRKPLKTKETKRLIYSEHGKGIDVMIRAMDHISHSFVPEGEAMPGSAVWQFQAMVAKADKTQWQLVNFSLLTDQDLKIFAEENKQFIEQFRLGRPRLRGKQRFADVLRRGFRDKTGRRNAWALMTRVNSLQIELIKEHEKNARIYDKYEGFGIAALGVRDGVRFQIRRAANVLGTLLESAPLNDPEFANKPDRLKNQHALNQIEVLRKLSFALDRLPIHPYSLAAGVVIRELGFDRSQRSFKFFHKGEMGKVTAQLWSERLAANQLSLVRITRASSTEIPEGAKKQMMEDMASKGIPFVEDYLRVHDFQGAARRIERLKEILELVLVKNSDFRNLKKTEKIEKEKKVPTPLNLRYAAIGI